MLDHILAFFPYDRKPYERPPQMPVIGLLPKWHQHSSVSKFGGLAFLGGSRPPDPPAFLGGLRPPRPPGPGASGANGAGRRWGGGAPQEGRGSGGREPPRKASHPNFCYALPRVALFKPVQIPEQSHHSFFSIEGQPLIPGHRIGVVTYFSWGAPAPQTPRPSWGAPPPQTPRT